MGLQPKIKNNQTFVTKQCIQCCGRFGEENFSPTSSPFYSGYLPWCNDCIKKFIDGFENEWEAVDKLCQWADIPFVPKEWVRLKEMNDNPFPAYARVFQSEEFEGIGWGDYYKEFKALEDAGMIEAELPLIDEDRKRKLAQKWGPGYDDEDLIYLENYYF